MAVLWNLLYQVQQTVLFVKNKYPKINLASLSNNTLQIALIFIKISVKKKISVLRLRNKIKNAFIRHTLSKLFLDDIVLVLVS